MSTPQSDINASPGGLKLKTARTLKWNSVDRFSSQILYAVFGVVLANILSKEDFGLVGALIVFQAFGLIFIDSGFGSALLQKKDPTQRDFSTIFWFNLAVSFAVYVILFFCAPLIADIFQGDRRLIPLSRVMFLTFILNGTALIQTTRLMKEMNVRGIAIANMLGLTISGGVGLWLAFTGAGAWALVWQSVVLAAVKSGWLWLTGRWLPRGGFSMESLRSMWKVGISVLSSSALNNFFLYIYSFVIGAFYNLVALGVYTQADKWSKMGSASLSHILTATFVPLLSKVQESRATFHRYITKINRFAAFILFPFMAGGAVLATPLFHTLFGTKWDAAIILFRILMVRGIFVVFISLYNNYILALGRGKRLFQIEVVKDSMVIIALLVTIWFRSVPVLVWGQLGASVATFIIVMVMTARTTLYPVRFMIADMIPFLLPIAAACAATLGILLLQIPAPLRLICGGSAGACVYFGITYLIGMKEPREAFGYLAGRFRAKS